MHAVLKQGYREDDGLFLESDTDEQLLINIHCEQPQHLCTFCAQGTLSSCSCSAGGPLTASCSSSASNIPPLLGSDISMHAGCPLPPPPPAPHTSPHFVPLRPVFFLVTVFLCV
jgi:hypothetical protein